MKNLKKIKKTVGIKVPNISKIGLICIFSFIILGILIFSIFNFWHYKKAETGNNISNKTLEEIEDYILNISSYDAEISVEVESNKNTNKYIMQQKYCKPNIASQCIIEPKNIEGLTVKYDGTNMEIKNSKLGLSTIYENYAYISDNVLWLSDFIQKYSSNNGTINEENGMVVMKFRCKNNLNMSTESLYIDKKANKITKLIIEDENRKSKVYIIYNKIEIGSLNKENVLAFEVNLYGKRDV